MRIYILIFAFILCSCNENTNISLQEAQTQIQQTLDSLYPDKYSIIKIEEDYSEDLFKEKWGFKVWLQNKKDATKEQPLFYQYNKYQKGWINYKGSKIEN